MYTQCPECLTIFEIDENTLQAALGIVQCGHCTQRFDALRSLSDSLPFERDAALTVSESVPRLPTLTKVVAVDADAGTAHRDFDPPSGTDTTADVLATPSDEELWLANLNTRHTDALLAAAAGIPHESRQDGDGWRLTLASPTQAHFAELDIIPLTPAELASIEAEGHGVPSEPGSPAPAESDTARAQPAAEPEASTVEDEAPYDLDEPAWLVDEAARESPVDDGNHAPDEHDMPAGPDDEPPLGDSPAVEGAAESTPQPMTTDTLAPSDAASETAENPAEGMDGDAAATDIATEPGPDAMAEPGPVYVRPRQRRFSRAGVLWALGCLLLALVLVAQLAWAKRVALFENSQARPWLVRICHSLPCQLPPIRDTAKLELLSRDIRPDPNVPGALTITATMRNNATFRQPWPIVAVEINDIDGNPVAMRRFRPARYMPDPTRRAAGIAAGATAAVAFEVVDPGKRAVAFQFSFE